MKAKRMVRTIETHTLGQPTRTVVSGFKHIPGKTMAEKFNYMKDNEDWFRKFLSFEPRGSEIMSGTIITEPCTPGTDVGILYYEASGWLPMCGHDTIGVTVALIEAGLVDVTEPITQISLDTAAGVVDVEARVIDGVVEEVSFLNAPALVLNRNITVNTKDFGPGKRKQFGSHAQDDSLFFILDGRCHHGIGKTRDRHHDARTGKLCNRIKKSQPCQKLRRHDQDHHHTDRSSLIRKSPSNKTFLQP